MLSVKVRIYDPDKKKDYIEGACLSTDDKPSSVTNGSVMIEMDTGTVYMFDENGKRWLSFE